MKASDHVQPNDVVAIPGATTVTEPSNSPIMRVLQVEDDALDAMIVDRVLRRELQGGYTLDQVGSLDEALQRLEVERYDAILLDLALPDSVGVETLKKISTRHHSIPILVLSGDEDPVRVTEALGAGAEEFLFKSRLDGEFLSGAIQRVVENGTRNESLSPHDRRRSQRNAVSGPAVIYPILPDHSPGEPIVATLVELSVGGMGLTIRKEITVPDVCLVGVNQKNDQLAFRAVRWLHRVAVDDQIRLGGNFLPAEEDPLDDAKLRPCIDSATLRLAPTINPYSIQQWVTRGVARRYVIDRVLACPSCQAIPTFRNGCAECGSASIGTSKLIHHFACAHVAPDTQFERNGGLSCPKCRAKKLVVGADFEHLEGPVTCRDCRWSGNAAVLIGECLRCGRRFPGTEATELEVIQYHVERMDPLAIIEANS